MEKSSGTFTKMNYQPRSMLITGGAGFIGANFIRYILENEPAVQVINLDKLTYAGSLDNLKNIPAQSRYHFIQGDICDAALVDHIMRHHSIDTIVHFAAESHVDRSIQEPVTFVETNVTGTFVLLEAVRHHWLDLKKFDASKCRFHHISTDEVYGALNAKDTSFTEMTRYQPRSPYSATKAASDHLVNAYHHTYGLPITLSNCSNNYGPHQHVEKFIPTIIRACCAWQPIPLYGSGKQIRDWIYVEDHCRGILNILKKGIIGESYNLGGSNEWENKSLANHICKQFDRIRPKKESHASLITFVPDRKGHDFRYSINSSKAKAELGWMPQINMNTGLEKTIQYYLSEDPP